MPVERCITTADAEQFVSGSLDDESSSVISAHVAACAECRSRIAAVERNLRFADRLVGRLQRRSTAADPPSSRRLPDAGDRYEILRELGRGGSAVVYEAQQHQPPRLVALKVLSVAHTLDQRRARLIEREARVLARLQHPNLAAIHDAGRTDDGRPFLVMELIRGVPLLEHARRGRHSMRRRLDLFAKVCDAVAHAHQRGVIHRDLKPSNILVDAAGEPKVLDFGLARLLEAEDSAPAISAVSEVGAIAGTVPYMSPEQVRGDRDAVDVRTDVYALGVVLYELLTEALPYLIDRANLPAAAQTICEAAPIRPSTAAPAVRGDVETIVLKALEKDPDRRYSTASALGDDIRRYLRGEPIAAKPATLGYQLRRLVGRHKPLFITAAGAALLLLALTVALAALVVRLDAQHRAALSAQAGETAHRIAAQRQARITGAINAFLNDMLAAANPERQSDAREARVIDVLDAAAAGLDGAFADEPEVESGIRLSLGTTYFALGQYEPAEFQLRAALALRQHPAFAESEDTAQILNKLARVLQETGRYEQSQEMYLRSLDLNTRLFGERSAPAAKLLNNLGWLLYLKREFAQAESHLRQALEVQIKLFGQESTEVATTLNNLAAVFLRTGRLDEAEALFRRSLAIDRVLLGEDHLNVAYTTANLAMVLADLGRLEEAEVIQRDALERIRRVLGQDHLSVGVTMHNLATMLRRLERPVEAEAHLREALDLYSRTVGEEHPRVADTLEHLGQILAQRGEDAGAEPLLRRSLDIRRSRLPAAHRSIVTLLLDLADILARTKREQQAVETLLEALAELDQAEDQPDLSDLRRRALTGLIELETSLGRTDQADTHQAELEALEAAAEP